MEIGNPGHKGDMQNRQKEYGYARDGGRDEVGEESLCVLLDGRSQQAGQILKQPRETHLTDPCMGTCAVL